MIFIRNHPKVKYQQTNTNHITSQQPNNARAIPNNSPFSPIISIYLPSTDTIDKYRCSALVSNYLAQTAPLHTALGLFFFLFSSQPFFVMPFSAYAIYAMSRK